MLTLFNSKAQLDLSVIADQMDEVALLNDTAQLALKNLIEAAKSCEAATERFLKAQAAVVDATREQELALADHIAKNPPPSFQDALHAAQDAYRKSH